MITADSKPVYCVFGGSDCWTCLDLMDWHKAMVKAFGKTEANKRFVDSWTNDAPFICKQYDCRSFDSSFRTYFKDAGILDNLYSGLGYIAKPFGFVTDTASQGSDLFLNTLKVLKWVVPIALIGVAIWGLYKLSKLSLA